jgi:hypothetical protein
MESKETREENHNLKTGNVKQGENRNRSIL